MRVAPCDPARTHPEDTVSDRDLMAMLCEEPCLLTSEVAAEVAYKRPDRSPAAKQKGTVRELTCGTCVPARRATALYPPQCPESLAAGRGPEGGQLRGVPRVERAGGPGAGDPGPERGLLRPPHEPVTDGCEGR